MNKDIQILVDKGEMLPLMEEFYTIQGEGFHKGTAAYFLSCFTSIDICVWRTVVFSGTYMYRFTLEKQTGLKNCHTIENLKEIAID